MFVLSSVSSSLESWSINYTSKYKNSELKAFKDITLLDKISNNCANVLFGTNV